MTIIEDLRAEKERHIVAAEALLEKANAENRDLNDTERPEVKSHIEAAQKAQQGIKSKEGDKAARDTLSGLRSAEAGGTAGLGDRPGSEPIKPGKSIGEHFTEHPDYREWIKAVGRDGRIPEGAALRSPPIGFDRKALVTGGDVTSAGALVTPDVRGLLDGLEQFLRPLTIVDLVTAGTTGSDVVEYARVTGVTNNAAVVPEATTSESLAPDDDPDNTMGVKPESELLLEKVTTPVKTIAHWIPATRRALSDAGQIRTLIDQFLNFGLAEELENQVLNGDGTGENFDGIMSTSGHQSAAWDTDLMVTTRKARTLVRTVGRARPTAYVFHPIDNERIDLSRDLNGQFYFGGPTTAPNAPLWGLPRVESEAMTQGVGMVADWKQAVLWDREQSSIQVSDSHADFFVRNLIAILAELRAAFGVIRPKAFVQIDLTA